jgi:hypothetical protein
LTGTAYLSDHVFAEMARQLGHPPLMLLDLRPVRPPMIVVTSHEVAEQITRVSKLFPWSTPKSPTMSSLVRLTGAESILAKNVRVSRRWPPDHSYWLLTDKPADHHPGRARTGSNFAGATTRGLRRSTS